MIELRFTHSISAVTNELKITTQLYLIHTCTHASPIGLCASLIRTLEDEEYEKLSKFLRKIYIPENDYMFWLSFTGTNIEVQQKLPETTRQILEQRISQASLTINYIPAPEQKEMYTAISSIPPDDAFIFSVRHTLE